MPQTPDPHCNTPQSYASQILQILLLDSSIEGGSLQHLNPCIVQPTAISHNVAAMRIAALNTSVMLLKLFSAAAAAAAGRVVRAQ
jgi:hypothetical protein